MPRPTPKDSGYLVWVEPRHEYFLKEAQLFLGVAMVGHHSDTSDIVSKMLLVGKNTFTLLDVAQREHVTGEKKIEINKSYLKIKKQRF